MKTVRNNKYFISILLGLIISLLILGGLTYAYFKDVFLPSGRIVMQVLLTIYAVFIYYFFKKGFEIPNFELTENGILLTSRQEINEIKWDEISDIDYYGRNGFLKMETIKIERKIARNPFLIYHCHYSNAKEITQAIQFCYDSYKNKGEIDLKLFVPIEITPCNNDNIHFENFNIISRTPFVTFRSFIPLVGIFGIYKILTAEYIPTNGLIGMFVVIAVSFLPAIIGIGKIGISGKYLVVENYYFPIKKVFRIAEIREIFIEDPGGKSAYAVRLITIDCNQKTFRIANFLKKDWIKLERVLKEKDLIVNNTLYKEKNKNKA